MQRMTLLWLATLLLTVTSANAQTSRGQAEITIDGNKMSIDYGQHCCAGETCCHAPRSERFGGWG